MINGAHIVLYSTDAEADAALFRDVLGWPHVDVGGGRLFFQLPPTELALHTGATNGRHELYLMCDDLASARAALAVRGVFTEEPTDHGWGVLTHLTLPGGGRLGLYEPRHPRAHG